jgi:hypothetical protein
VKALTRAITASRQSWDTSQKFLFNHLVNVAEKHCTSHCARSLVEEVRAAQRYSVQPHGGVLPAAPTAGESHAVTDTCNQYACFNSNYM